MSQVRLSMFRVQRQICEFRSRLHVYNSDCSYLSMVFGTHLKHLFHTINTQSKKGNICTSQRTLVLWHVSTATWRTEHSCCERSMNSYHCVVFLWRDKPVIGRQFKHNWSYAQVLCCRCVKVDCQTFLPLRKRQKLISENLPIALCLHNQ